ncbi:MAG: alpha-L-rhamnosidase [Bacteroidales bacterium]|nr:alpha-L-rhamnosidase [Bacteroidales bacterium]
MRLVNAILLIALISIANISCGKDYYIYNLATDLIMETDVVFSNGLRTNYSLETLESDTTGKLRAAEIHNARPLMSWMIYNPQKNITQAKYQIIVASSLQNIDSNNGDVWDSGLIEESSSVSVRYGGEPLKPSTIYYWKVRIVDNKGNKYEYSAPRGFITAAELDEYTSVLPLERIKQQPVNMWKTDKSLFVDFGDDSFGQLFLRFNSFTGDKDKLTIHIGESVYDKTVNRLPMGTVRYQKYKVALSKGYNNYQVEFNPNPQNTDPNVNGGALPVLMPDYIGEVLPFRYVQIENYHGPLMYSNITRDVITYPFNNYSSAFESSDTILNQIWNLCKHTMKATSFAGTFVDGDRERITYEGDALINQLSHYAVDYQYSIARNTLERLISHPTWPTEWILSTLAIAYNDYMYTGDVSFLEKHYDDLMLRTLYRQMDPYDNLLHSGFDIIDPHTLQTLHTHSPYIRDIIDWPMTEQDCYETGNCNTATNAYFQHSLALFAKIAAAVGNSLDARKFEQMAEKTRQSINSLMTSDSTQLYVDNTNSLHQSLHANMYPLAFGIVDQSRQDTVAQYIKSKGMACSVFGAQFLINALYNAGEQQHALRLLTDTSSRSWYQMIRSGSSMTTEAWNDTVKSNQDWNHPWGASPANIITRKIMGIEPLEPGFRKIRIKPMAAGLEHASITSPTPRGPVRVSIRNSKQKNKSTLKAEIPANMAAEIILPNGKSATVGSGIWEYKF